MWHKDYVGTQKGSLWKFTFFSKNFIECDTKSMLKQKHSNSEIFYFFSRNFTKYDTMTMLDLKRECICVEKEFVWILFV